MFVALIPWSNTRVSVLQINSRPLARARAHTHTHTNTHVSLTLQKGQSVNDSKHFFCDPSVTKRQRNLLPAKSEVLTARLDQDSSLGGCYTVSIGINSYWLFVDSTLFRNTRNTTNCLRMFDSWGSLRNQAISYLADFPAISPTLKNHLFHAPILLSPAKNCIAISITGRA